MGTFGERPRTARAQAAPQLVEGEILVRFRPGLAGLAAADVHRQEGGQVARTVGKVGVDVVRVPRGQERARAAAYRRNPNVLFAEPNGVYRVFGAPNDTRALDQWQFQNVGLSGGKVDADIDAYQAWNTTEGSASIAIAILDTGIDQSHEDLAAKIVKNANFSSNATWEDGHGHGTHVAGSAAAITNNGIGVAGTCPKCSLINVKVMNDSGEGSWDQIAQGIIWAADNGAKVINMSLGGLEQSATLEAAVDYAWSQGVIVVAAAGNDGTPQQFFPAAYPNVIAVGATNHNDVRAGFSNYGTWVDVAAPGESILSTAPDHLNATWFFGAKYGTISGTSMATPHVAGLAGLVWSSGMCEDAACVRSRIESTAEPVAGTGTYWSHGRINACLAVGGTCTTPTNNQKPSITITSPAPGAAVSGSVAITMRATDVEDASASLVVSWNVNGGAYTRATYNAATGNHQATWNTSSLAPGAYVIGAHVLDSEGSASMATVSVTKDVASSGTITFGQSVTVTIPTANQVALLSFQGEANQRVSLRMTNSSLTGSYISLAKPDGTALGNQMFAGKSGGFMDARVLPVAGTYTIKVDPTSTYTGSITITLYDVPADVSAGISAGGASVPVTMGTPGQNARLTFSGSANQQVAVELTGVTVGASTCCGVKLSILKPDGVALATADLFGTRGGVTDNQVLPVAGTYTILIDPQGAETGSATVTLHNVPADVAATASVGGASVTLANSAPFQNIRVTFAGTAGQRLGLGFTSVTMGSSTSSGVKATLLQPDGSPFDSASFGTNGNDVDVPPLPVSGTYTLLIDPQDRAAGSVTVTLSAEVTGSLTLGGAPLALALNRPGQDARVTFAGTAGQSVVLSASGVTVGTSTCCGVTIKVYRPDGTTLTTKGAGTNGASWTLSLPATGTYTVWLDPQYARTGNITLQLAAPMSTIEPLDLPPLPEQEVEMEPEY
jgi:thermitase